MEKITTKALVLRSIPYLDNHRLLTLFSADLGKLSAVAHGALSVKSKLRSASALFAGGEYVLSGRDDRLSVVSFCPDGCYFGAMDDLSAATHASYLCALCDTVLQPGQPAPELFSLLMEAMAHLCYGEHSPVLVFNAYLLRMLDALGYAPELNACRVCGANKGQPKFVPDKGGLCCHRCAPGASDVSREALAFLRGARSGAIGALTEGQAVALRALLTDYCHVCIDRKLRAADMLSL